MPEWKAQIQFLTKNNEKDWYKNSFRSPKSMTHFEGQKLVYFKLFDIL